MCSFGTCRNFQAEPGPGGLLTWGEIIGEAESIGLESSRGWKALDAEAFDSRAPKMSFALNPAEILDSRRLPAEWDSPDFDDSAWPAASEVRDQEHWGAPEPRPIDFLNETPVRPASVSGVFAASHPQDEEILSFRLVTEPLETGAPAVAAVFAACWTGEDASEIAGLEWPLQDPEQLPKGLGSLQAQPRGNHAGLPFYDRAWLDFRPIAAAMPIDDLDWDALSHQLRSNEKLVLGLDFEREILGRPRVGFNAESGGILDIAYSERANGQGLPQVAYRYQVEMGERCIARGGSQQWHLFHPRGFRYLELIVHQPQRFTLDDLDVTQFIYPTPEQEGEFRCSDPLLEKIWRAGAEALRVNKENVYMDCPHRERGLYVGDSLVEFMADRASFGDTDIFRRSLELYWHGQGSNGLVKPAAHHSARHGSHPDYSALMPQLLWTWFEATGDLDLVRRYRDQVLKLVEGLLSLRDDDGVYSDCGMNSYIDIARTARKGPSCAMNCFVKEACASVGRLMPLLDEAEEGRRWEGEAVRVSEMIRRQFFDADVNRFLDYPGTSEYERGYSVHGNTLALLYGVADKSRAQPIVDWICGELENNFHNDPPRNGEDLNVNAYFSYYTLGALLDHGRLDEALRFIRKFL
ncbi:MAG: hypothetical protein ACOC4K_05485 [Verrucomicrobiota bacterium]